MLPLFATTFKSGEHGGKLPNRATLPNYHDGTTTGDLERFKLRLIGVDSIETFAQRNYATPQRKISAIESTSALQNINRSINQSKH